MEIIPGISKRQIDDARRHADLRGPGKPSNAPEIIRVRLDATKTDHFLEFYFFIFPFARCIIWYKVVEVG